MNGGKKWMPLLLLGSLLVCLGCQRKNGSVENASDLQADSMALLELKWDTLLPVTEPRLVASLEKTPCYGRCPVFKVKFYANGDLSYEGVQNTDRQGIFLAKIAPDSVRQIVRFATGIPFFQLADAYPVAELPLADLPNTLLYFSDGEQEKTILINHDAPKALIQLENYLTGLMEEATWMPKVE